MQRLANKGISYKDNKTAKLITHTSKNKKDLKHCPSKNIKAQKLIISKSPYPKQESKIRKSSSPDIDQQGQQIDNDYGVNPYYAKYKVKTSNKKEAGNFMQNTDYGTLNTTRDAVNVSQFDAQINQKNVVHDSDYSSSAFQKIKIPANKGLINADGKFVSNTKSKEQKNNSFHNNSCSRHSASLNFTSRDDSKYRKKGKSKSKKRILLDQQKSIQYRLKCKSSERNTSKQHYSYYYEKGRPEHKQKAQKRQKKIKQKQHTCQKIESINSKVTSIGTQLQIYSPLYLAQDPSAIDKVKDQIADDIKNIQKYPKVKLAETACKQRIRCLMMLSRICGALHAKRQSFYLTIQYLDNFIGQFHYNSMKLIALGCLTLALKMDDAEMISKFCYYYLYNPEKTVKKNSNNNQIKIKQKRQSVAAKEERNKFATIINSRIAEDRKIVKQDYCLEEVLDCETHIMVKFEFKLLRKTINYWIDMLTAIWDSYIEQFCPKYAQTLMFRNDKSPRNISYVIQFFELEQSSMDLSRKSKVSITLASIYLVARMALHEKKQQMPWQQICKFYQVSLSRSTNLIFCDGVGINILFGDFLTLLDLSMTNIIDSVQILSHHLQPSIIKPIDYRKVEGLNRQDRLATHIYCEQLYRNTSS